MTVKEEQGPDGLLCFVVEGGYIQAWSIVSFANFWLSMIIIMIILKKLHIAPDKLHECSTITEVIYRAHSCPRQNLTNSAANFVNPAAHRGNTDEIPWLTAVTPVKFRGLTK